MTASDAAAVPGRRPQHTKRPAGREVNAVIGALGGQPSRVLPLAGSVAGCRARTARCLSTHRLARVTQIKTRAAGTYPGLRSGAASGVRFSSPIVFSSVLPLIALRPRCPVLPHRYLSDAQSVLPIFDRS